MSKIYILDTSVIVDNPESVEILRNEGENEVFIPYSVILELSKLKKKPDLSYIVSEIGTRLEGDSELKIIRHNDIEYRDMEIDDERIFIDIKRFIDTLGEDDKVRAFVVSNDKFFRIRLKYEGIQAQEFKSSQPIFSESQVYTGFVENGNENIPNSFRWVEGKPLFNTKEPHLVEHENKPWGITPRNIYQNLAIELMLDPDIDIVSIQSQAGYGKTFLALACALELVLNKEKIFGKIFIIKPNIEIGEKIGFLPGEIEEKLEPFYKPIEDLILKLHDIRPANRLFAEKENGKVKLNYKKCEVLPLNFIRGMNLEDCVVIVDEAQNLTRLQTRTLLTRMGHGVKCFVLGDTEQVDHPYLDKYNNGLNWVVKKFKGFTNYGHIVLKGSKSRGPITDMVLKSNL